MKQTFSLLLPIESPRSNKNEGANHFHECGVKRDFQRNMQNEKKTLTCCDDFDTEDVEFDDEFSRFCRDASPFVVGVVTVVGGLNGFFLLKFSNIDAISGDMLFCGVLLTIIVSGSSDI
jgi:hypothetical protein